MARRSSASTASFCSGGRPCFRRMPAMTSAICRSPGQRRAALVELPGERREPSLDRPHGQALAPGPDARLRGAGGEIEADDFGRGGRGAKPRRRAQAEKCASRRHRPGWCSAPWRRGRNPAPPRRAFQGRPEAARRAPARGSGPAARPRLARSTNPRPPAAARRRAREAARKTRLAAFSRSFRRVFPHFARTYHANFADSAEQAAAALAAADAEGKESVRPALRSRPTATRRRIDALLERLLAAKSAAPIGLGERSRKNLRRSPANYAQVP